MKKQQEKPDPLAPIVFAWSVLASLVGAALLAVAVATLFGSGSFLSLAGTGACATVGTGQVSYQFSDPPGRVDGLGEAAIATERTVEVCQSHPGTLLRLEASIGAAAEMLLLVGGLVLVGRLIWVARRERIFTEPVAARMRALGWFLLIGCVVSAFLQAVSSGLLISHVVDHQSWTAGLSGFHVPWTLLLIGFGVISFARVVSHAVTMQDDLDTVI